MSLSEKLNYLDSTKSQIKQAIINKGQEVSDTDTFREYVQKIENIETGVDTSDATATASDIISPKTAYVNGRKITGAMIATEKTLSVDEYTKYSVLPTAPTKIYNDSIYVAGYIINMTQDNTNLYIDIIAGDTLVKHAEFALADIGFFTDARNVVVSYDTVTEDGIDIVVGIMKEYKNSSQLAVLNLNFRKFLFDPEENTITINSELLNNDQISWLGDVGVQVPNIVADRQDRYLYHLLYVNEDWGQRTGYRSIKIMWNELGVGTVISNMSQVTKLYTSWQDNKLGNTGDGSYLTYGRGLIQFTNVTKTAISQKDVGVPIYLSHNKQYMVQGTTLYKVTPNSNINTMYDSKVSIGTIVSNTNVDFSQDDHYAIVTTASAFYVYEISTNSMRLAQTLIKSGISTIPWDSNFMVSNQNDGTGLIFYDCTGQNIIKQLERDNKKYYYAELSEVPNTSEVLLNKQYIGLNGTVQSGTMPNNGAINITPSISSQSIPAGYTSGGTVSAVTSAIDANITQANIRAGVTILGVQGNLEPDKPDQTKTCTPTTSQQIIEPDTGYELASVTVNGVTSAIDSNIQAGNIKKDVTILGVTGTLEQGIDTSDATATSSDILESKTAYVNGEKIEGTVVVDDWENSMSIPELEKRIVGEEDMTTEQLVVKQTANHTVAITQGSTVEIVTETSEVKQALDIPTTEVTRIDTSPETISTSEDGSGLILEGHTHYGEDLIYREREGTYTDFEGTELSNGLCIALWEDTEFQMLAEALGIVPDKIKVGEIICGVTGTLEQGIDTSDATATASDIISPKTAYVNGEKITGAMPNNGALSYTPTMTQQSIPAGYTSGGTIDAITDGFTGLNIPSSINVEFDREGSFDMELPTIQGINWGDVSQLVRNAIRVKGEDEWHYTDWEDEETGEYEEMCMDIQSQYSGDEYGNLPTIIGFNEDDEKYHINLDRIHIYKENFENYDFKLVFKLLNPTSIVYKNADITFNVSIPTDVMYDLFITGPNITSVEDVTISVKDTNNNDIPYNAYRIGKFSDIRIRLLVQTDKDGEISVTYNGDTQTRTLDTTNNLNNGIYTYRFGSYDEDIEFD